MKKIALPLIALFLIVNTVFSQSEPEIVFDYMIGNHTLVNNGFIFIDRDSILFSNGELGNRTFLVDSEYVRTTFFNVVKDDKVFFIRSINDEYSLWITDGTVDGTHELKDFDRYKPSFKIMMGDKLFFTANDGTHGEELWVTDGTASGTFMLKDIYEGEKGGLDFQYANDYRFYEFNNKLFFRATDSLHGSELWVTDGTKEGTYLLKDIYEGEESGITETDFFTLNNELFFSAEDSVYGLEIWKTDGTEAGTQLLKDINPGKGNFVHPNSQGFSTHGLINNKFVFSASDGVHGQQLWITDGTEVGTYMVKEVNPDTEWKVYFIGALNNQVFFSVSNSPTELGFWVTDGTAEGTLELVSFNRYFLYVFYKTDNKLYFIHEENLWVTDGTREGTYIFKESFNVGRFINDKVYYTVREHKDSAFNFNVFDFNTGSTNYLGQLPAADNVSYFYLNNQIICLLIKDLQGATYEAFDISVFNIEDNSFHHYDLGQSFNKDFTLYGQSYYPHFVFNNYFYFNVKEGIVGPSGENERFRAFARIELKSGDNGGGNTGIEELVKLSNVFIYPNPASTELNLKGVSDNFEYVIKDLQGRIIKSGKNEKNINIASLLSGLYFIQISDGEQNIQSKFIKL